MTLSHDETKQLIDEVIKAPPQNARRLLHFSLQKINRAEPEFYSGVIKHGPGMPYTSDQWFDFFSRVPVKVFRDESTLMNKLSEEQRSRLGFE